MAFVILYNYTYIFLLLLVIYMCTCRLADNLPAATVFRNLKTNELQYEDGFKLGFVHEKRTVLNNHLTIIIKYHQINKLVMAGVRLKLSKLVLY